VYFDEERDHSKASFIYVIIPRPAVGELRLCSLSQRPLPMTDTAASSATATATALPAELLPLSQLRRRPVFVLGGILPRRAAATKLAGLDEPAELGPEEEWESLWAATGCAEDELADPPSLSFSLSFSLSVTPPAPAPVPTRPTACWK